MSITWTYWTASSALGHGLHISDDCAPNCAEGKIGYVPVTVALSDPVHGEFTEMSETASGHVTSDGSGPGFFVEGAGPTSAEVALPTSPATTPSSPTTPSTTSIPSPAGPGPTAGVDVFLSPSRNISCEIDYQRSGLPDSLYCQTFSPLQSVTMATTGAFKTCTGSDCVGNPGEDTPILAYGDTTTIGPFKCISATSGVTCTAAGTGFEISSSGITKVP